MQVLQGVRGEPVLRVMCVQDVKVGFVQNRKVQRWPDTQRRRS